jgi:nitrate/TMAO reductase-like tetraheme cytochrome c subunit
MDNIQVRTIREAVMNIRILPMIIVFTILYGALSLVWAAESGGETGKETFKYVGKRNCRSCHSSKAVAGVEYRIWEESPHAGAWQTLKGNEALKIGAELGIDKPSDSEKCLPCHTTAWGVDEKLKDENTHPSHGVTCEACHGPGSGYKDFKVMQNPELAVKNGLVAKPGEELCKSCHNDRSPTFKGFDFKEAWTRISHGKERQD